jgi:hypothetical protein
MHFHIVKMYNDKEVKNVNNFFVDVWRKNIFDIYVTEYGTALTTILPILFIISLYPLFYMIMFTYDISR